MGEEVNEITGKVVKVYFCSGGIVREIKGDDIMMSYNEIIENTGSTYTYDLYAKLNELGFSGNDLAIITAMPVYYMSEPLYSTLYVYDDHSYNTIASSGNGSVGLCATLTATMPSYNTAKLKFAFNGGGTDNIHLSIRIIKG